MYQPRTLLAPGGAGGGRAGAGLPVRVVLHDLDDREALRTCLGQADLLVNTTPVGMERMPGCLIPDASWLHAGLTVSDVIYQPRETQLLRMAREAGLKTFNGSICCSTRGRRPSACGPGGRCPSSRSGRSIFNRGLAGTQNQCGQRGKALTALLRLQDGAGGAAGTIQVFHAPQSRNRPEGPYFLGRLSENQESGKPPRQKEKKRPGEVCTTAEGGGLRGKGQFTGSGQTHSSGSRCRCCGR